MTTTEAIVDTKLTMRGHGQAAEVAWSQIKRLASSAADWPFDDDHFVKLLQQVARLRSARDQHELLSIQLGNLQDDLDRERLEAAKQAAGTAF